MRAPTAIILGVAAYQLCACGQYGDARGVARRAHASQLTAEVQRRTVPPAASKVVMRRADARPCVIGREWSFVTTETPDEYTRWLSAQLVSDFRPLAAPGDQLIFSRYAQGDAHSLIIEPRTESGHLRVRVNLCVFPD